MDIYFDPDLDDFCNIAAILGFDVSQRDIQYSGFWSQGDGASFTGSFGYSKGMCRKIRQYASRDTELHAIADDIYELQRRNFYQLNGSITRISSRYCHENTILCGHVDRDSCNYQDATDDAEDIMTDVARRLSQWLYSQLEKEYEYQESWQKGQEARYMAQEAREHGTEYVNALREIKSAWRMRHGAACVTGPDVRDGIRDAIKTARIACEEYLAARETWKEAINVYVYDDAAFKEGYEI